MNGSQRHSTHPRGNAGPPRFMLYSHDGMGLGHIRRNLNLASALIAAEPTSSVLLATGAEDLDAFTIPDGVDVVRFPGLRKAGGGYQPRRLQLAATEVHALRAELLRSTVASFAPDVLVADRHPGGVSRELVPALELQRAAGRRTVLGLRDVLDSPDRVDQEWVHGTARQDVERFIDQVLIYGNDGLLDPFHGSAVSSGMRALGTYCGYVVDTTPTAHDETLSGPRPVVLTTSGGGEDGQQVLNAALDAGALAPWRTVIVSGPHMDPGARERLAARALLIGAEFHTSITDLGRHLGQVDAVVCMGGYNTVTEVLAAGVPAVCIPRVVPRREQLIRAGRLADHGLLQCIHPGQVTPSRLRTAIGRALQWDRSTLRARIAEHMTFDGAGRAAALLVTLARTGMAPARPLASPPDPRITPTEVPA
ncbi:glycosyltransferase family protein [Euzebya tangerina]|uniref:glycosyltransferase family protein n=1 Tax=Euzebya tangerina TaxID=591198 RepID=UPI000E30E1AE|nr:glycosyltransferase [Euzebya tangerina]